MYINSLHNFHINNKNILFKKSINSINSINSITMLFKPSNQELILLSSILLETLSTCCLKKTMVNKIWYIPVYTGYGLSFYLFPKSLTQFSLSSAYTIWCGFGIILTTIIDKIFYNQLITLKKICGTIIVIIGIYFSN